MVSRANDSGVRMGWPTPTIFVVLVSGADAVELRGSVGSEHILVRGLGFGFVGLGVGDTFDMTDPDASDGLSE